MITRVALGVLSLLVVSTFVRPSGTLAEEPVQLKYSQAEIENKWRVCIQSFLDKGVIPLIDLLSFLPRENSALVIRWTKDVMVVNAESDRFILTTNKGGNKNWWKQKSGRPWDYIEQLEQRVLGGDYPFIGQIEFRHYMSNAQCKAGKTHRDIDIPLNGDNGHRVFQLSSQTGVPFSIHLEPEDKPLDALEEMLASYPKAKVIVSHFGQIRHPDRETKFGPKLVERLLSTYPGLYYDLSAGNPGRYYRCNDYKVMDTVIWEDSSWGRQKNTLKVEYKDILTKFSNRFVVGFDYGPYNRQHWIS
jgi:hypothetical protein